MSIAEALNFGCHDLASAFTKTVDAKSLRLRSRHEPESEQFTTFLVEVQAFECGHAFQPSTGSEIELNRRFQRLESLRCCDDGFLKQPKWLMGRASAEISQFLPHRLVTGENSIARIQP